jgi:hypothetical protein
METEDVLEFKGHVRTVLMGRVAEHFLENEQETVGAVGHKHEAAVAHDDGAHRIYSERSGVLSQWRSPERLERYETYRH